MIVLVKVQFACNLFSALSYKYIVEQQPIGRELFRLFCETQPEYKKSIDFLDAVVSYFCLDPSL